MDMDMNPIIMNQETSINEITQVRSFLNAMKQFKEDAEIKVALSKAEKEYELNKPRNVDHLKELLGTDFRTMYAGLDPEGRQEFWQDLIKEIKLDGKTVTGVTFYT